MNSSALREHLRQLFAEVDTDNNGSLGRAEFSELCAKIGLSNEAANETFDRLDIDKNDRITFDEFAAGFNQYKQVSPTPSASVAANSSASASRIPLSSSTTSCSSSVLLSLASSQQNSQTLVNSSTTKGIGIDVSSKSSTKIGRSLQNQSGSLSPGAGSGVVSARSVRKSASPLGIMSLGSTGGSSGNLIGGSSSGGRSSSTGADVSDFTSAECQSSIYGSNNIVNSNNNNDFVGSTGRDSMVVYSSDQIVNDSFEQASGSGQFGSLMSSSGSLRNVQDVLEVVQKLQNENQILTQLFVKDKREREEYISQLGEEFDQQVREVEERANRRAKEEWENEKKRLMDRMQAERETLQNHYQTIEKMSKFIKSSNGKITEDNESIDKVKSKLEDTYLENRQLKKSLLDTKTDVAMIWKEMEKLKRQYEDKLSSAYERNNETRNECDHIKQQLTLMKDSNRKLQDASDVITNYITDKVELVIKGTVGGQEDDINYLSPNVGGGSTNKLNASSQSNSRRGSILSEYLNGNQSNSINGYEPSMNSADLESIGDSSNQSNSRAGDAEERLSAASSSTGNLQVPVPKPLPRGSVEQGGGGRRTRTDSKSHTNNAQQQQSNLSQADDNNTISTTTTNDSNNHQRHTNQSLADEPLKKSSSYHQQTSSNNDNERDDLRTSLANNSISANQSVSLEDTNQIKLKDQLESKKSVESNSSRSGIRNIGRHFFIGSRAQSDAQLQSKDSKTVAANNAGVASVANNPISSKSASVDSIEESIIEPADGPSKATFNIILVGDSFVGKSSFAARFMEGSFVQGLISNCSIDFKTKAYKVDGVNYIVNLWDTAGQERFRSITASYFRKADGIILMYDVTDKRSYLNVRNWMSTISDTAAENVAVLLVGNKIDLRQKQNKEKCVPTEEGFRLAKEYEIVFLETSVKTGMNLNPSMGKLIRLIAKNNLPDEEDKDRIRLNDKSRTFNCMPKNC